MTNHGRFIECIMCKKNDRNFGRGLCQSCYMKERRKSEKGVTIVCSVCKDKRIHKAKGKCELCYVSEYRKTHKEQHANHERNRRNRDPERYRELDRKRNKTDKRREWQKEHNKKYYMENIEKAQEYNRKWMKENREKMNHYIGLYNSRKRRLPSTLTQKEWKDILEKCDHRCVYCNRQMKRLTKDHVLPASRGGGYTSENIVPACGSCNSRKHNKTPEEFSEYLKKYPMRQK